MKSGLLAIGLLLLLPLILIIDGCNTRKENESAAISKSSTPMEVDEAMRNLKEDTTTIAVQGVVQSVMPDKHLLALVDIEEYRRCGINECCLYMPVRWPGTMPAVEDFVVVTGAVASSDSGLVFLARELAHMQVSAGRAE